VLKQHYKSFFVHFNAIWTHRVEPVIETKEFYSYRVFTQEFFRFDSKYANYVLILKKIAGI